MHQYQTKSRFPVVKEVSFNYTNSTADSYVAVMARESEVLSVRFRHATTGTGTINVMKVPSGTAITSGTSVLAAAFDVSTGANNTTVSPALSATHANRILNAGDALAIDVTSLATVAGGVLTITYVTR